MGLWTGTPFKIEYPKSRRQLQSREQTLSNSVSPLHSAPETSPPPCPERDQIGQRCHSGNLSLQVKGFKMKELFNDCLYY